MHNHFSTPAPAHFMDDSEHWRARASKIRELVKGMHDGEAKVEMLKVAADYDGLAQRAEERISATKTQSR
jgi:hypothetical protein